MIMINPLGSGEPVRRIGNAGPPPPVPPRPAKSVVAEALAKSRLSKAGTADFRCPTRRAPPPPVASQGKAVAKSHSSQSINVGLNKPPVVERSISEELKCHPRPVVYQSTNVRNNRIVNVTAPVANSDERSENIVTYTSGSEANVSEINEEKDSRKAFACAPGDNDHIESASFIDITREIGDGSSSTYLVKTISTNRDSFSRNIEVTNSLTTTHSEDTEDNNNTEKTPTKTSTAREFFDYFRSSKNIVVEDISEGLYLDNQQSPSSILTPSADDKDTESTCWDPTSKDRNHVNTLIKEMFASVLEVEPDEKEPNNNNVCELSLNERTHIVVGSEKSDEEIVIVDVDPVQVGNVPKTVILITSEDIAVKNNSSESGKQVKFKDQTNHEQLISELQYMKKGNEKILKRQRKPSKVIYEEKDEDTDRDSVARAASFKIQRPNKLDLSGVTLERTSSFSTAKESRKESIEGCDRIPSMSSIHGLPPLPKSLSGHYVNLGGPPQPQLPPTPMRTSSKMRQQQQQPVLTPSQSRKATPTALDAKLALLRQEMYSLRQLDLSLLGKLWSLNESIQDFRQLLILQDENREVLSPPSPSPSSPAASSVEDEDGDFYMSAVSLDYRPAPPSGSANSKMPSCSSDTSSR